MAKKLKIRIPDKKDDILVETTQKGLAIGRDAKNLKVARELMSRHHNIDSVSVA